jgi:hypothetical protein
VIRFLKVPCREFEQCQNRLMHMEHTSSSVSFVKSKLHHLSLPTYFINRGKGGQMRSMFQCHA